jgi:Tol biopolymer transport system component
MPAQRYTWPRVSPDGQQIAVSITREGGRDLWVYAAATGAGLRLTRDDENNHIPMWTPDGRQILFSSTSAPRPASHTGTWWGNVYTVPADGSGEAVRVTTTDESQALSGISPDGQTLVYSRVMLDRWEIMGMPVDGSAEPAALVSGPFRQGSGTISPNGRWLAYRSDETGTFEIYVEPFPGPGAKIPVSIGGGNEAVWSLDSRELFYLDNGGTMMAARITGEAVPQVSERAALFSAAPFRSAGVSAHQHHVAPDGRFLMMRVPGTESEDDEVSPPEITVVLNWFEELRARVLN